MSYVFEVREQYQVSNKDIEVGGWGEMMDVSNA
jgi:hypothetical protein